MPTTSFPPTCGSGRQRLLVLWQDLDVSGGLLRFERAGAVLRAQGHELAFVALPGALPVSRPRSSPLLSFSEAHAKEWDAMIVPGAGFPNEVIEALSLFRTSGFGVRVQHLLNDQSRRASFKKVNERFAPQLVVINNLDWPAGSYDEFEADEFHVLLGAVDVDRFRNCARRRAKSCSDEWVVGGLATKNPGPLMEALDLLPAQVKLRLYGPDRFQLCQRHADLIDAHRLELVGVLQEGELPAFYQSLDCVAMTELHAGWSNLVAEAMASGVPVVCTTHGTAAFAYDRETALVVSEPTAEAMAAALNELKNDSALRMKLVANALHAISAFTWESYATRLLELICRYRTAASAGKLLQVHRGTCAAPHRA